MEKLVARAGQITGCHGPEEKRFGSGGSAARHPSRVNAGGQQRFPQDTCLPTFSVNRSGEA